MNIPEPWNAALAAVKRIAPEAVIAGGALRDLDNGREVKDIDIFVRGTTEPALARLRNAVVRAGFDAEEIDPSKMYPVGDGQDVVGHFDAEFPGCDVPVQIIMVNHDCAPEVLVTRFDYGICRIVYDGETLLRAPEYLSDQAAEVFKLRRQRTDQELVASVHRFARLRQKYDGWRFDTFESASDDFEALL